MIELIIPTSTVNRKATAVNPEDFVAVEIWALSLM